MTKLHQLLAVAQGTKQRSQQALTKFYHAVQKPEPFSGILKIYRPKDEDGEKLPSEGVRVQRDAAALLQEVIDELKPMYSIVGDIDRTNQAAMASVEIDGRVILADVPVSTLLWMEKQLADLRTVLGSLPVLNPEHTWAKDASTDMWTTPERVTVRAKKIPRNHEKAPATDKHPAQVEVYYEDVNVGTWHTRILSGGMPQVEVRTLQKRLEVLRDAVKDARERANATDVQRFDASPVLDFLFQGI